MTAIRASFERNYWSTTGQFILTTRAKQALSRTPPALGRFSQALRISRAYAALRNNRNLRDAGVINTEQGSQFRERRVHPAVLKHHGIKIGTDGKRRSEDNARVEWLWKSVICEHVYSHVHESVSGARQRLPPDGTTPVPALSALARSRNY